MEQNKILITGGTGKTGRRVAERLAKLGKGFQIGSRTATPAFDWEKPETWANALEGINYVYITFQPDLAIPSAVGVITEFTSLAVKSGIQKLVLLSGRGEQKAQVCEQIIINSGLDYTIVRCSWFNQNFSESYFLDPILAGYVALPQAEALEPFLDADDIADVVVEALLDAKHNKQIYELTGPRLMNFKQVIAEISKQTDRDIVFQSLTISEYTDMLRSYQVPEDYLWLVNYLFTEVLDGRNSSITHDVEKVLGRKAKDFTDFAADAAAAGIWNPILNSQPESV